MVRSSSVDPDMIKKCIKCLINRPDMKVPAAMKLTNFSVEEVANLSLRRFIQRSLPGKTLEGLKAHALASLPPPPPQPDRAERRLNRAIDDEGAVDEPGSRACALAVTPSPLLPRPPPASTPQSGPSSSDASMASSAVTTAMLTIAANKRKIWNREYYLRKKLRLLDGAIATVVDLVATTNPTAMATADSVAAVAAITDGLSRIADVAAAADPWSLDNNGVVRTPSARRKAKSRQVKPAVDAILRAGSIDAQAAVLRAVADHTSLKDACDLARISSSKEQAAHKFVCEQSARMMERNRATEKLRANVTSDKRLAAEVMLTFSAPSPDKVRGVPSQRD